MLNDVVGWAEVFCLTLAAIAATRLALRTVIVVHWLIAPRRPEPRMTSQAGPNLRAPYRLEWPVAA